MANSSRTGLSFEDSVKAGFNRAKEDQKLIKDELNELKSAIDVIMTKFDEMKEKNQILRDLVNSNANSISILAEALKQRNQQDPLSSTGTSSTGKERVPGSAEQELVKVFKRNKPQIVKHKIIELALTEQYTLYDIYEVIVVEQRICGKTTFYRYVKDLELEGAIEVHLIDGKRRISTSSTEFRD